MLHDGNKVHGKGIKNEVSAFFKNPSVGNHNWLDGILGDSPKSKFFSVFINGLK